MGEVAGEAASAVAAQARRRAARLGDEANELGAAGRVAEVSPLWETAIAEIDDAELRDRVMLAYAWYQALHGETGHGLRIAAELRDSPVGAVQAQVRVLVRHCWRGEPDATEGMWASATGSPPPSWVRMAEETLSAVADWLRAADWPTSQGLHEERVAPLPTGDILTALHELSLMGDHRGRPRIELHRAIVALGGPAAYRCLADADEAAAAATTAIAARDWDALSAVGTLEALAHRRLYLGSVHVVAAEAMTAGGRPVDAAIAERLRHLAGTAPLEERVRAADDIRVVGHEAVAGLRTRED